MKRLAFILCLCCVVADSARAQGDQPRTPQPSTTSQQPSVTTSANADDATQRLRQESFETVWRTINDSHFDPTFGGVDWRKIHDVYAPQVAATKSDAEFNDLLRRMVGELKLSHFYIYPPGAFEQSASEAKGQTAAGAVQTRGDAGIDVRVINSQAIVTRVAPDSAAMQAGIKLGFIITKIDDNELAPVFERLAKSDLSAAYKEAYMHGSVTSRLAGKTGDVRRITFLDETDKSREAKITLLASTDEMSQPFGNFPAVATQFEARRLANNIGYIRFNIWVISLMDKIRRSVREFSDTRAIIFDLRGNQGGVGAMSIGITGMLSDKPISLGAMQQRNGFQNFLSNPQPDPYKGAVVVLVDGQSASTSEIFALGLQEAGRATVVGTRSAGAALPSVFMKLPTGAILQYAFADFRTPKGVRPEGRGVVPDREVKMDRRTLLTGRDPQMDAAIEIIMRAGGTGETSPSR